ncbi:MAG: sulfite exporter TauE/SafE family protein, partial [Pelagibacteraceae bacterium]|nr:sulfite exporter TauE/SafE family protein [Pelagibacteraceae bacterium]
MEISDLFYILLPLVAFLYASVGHGGASGYLALMAIFGISVSVMKPTALILNLFVAGISFYYFYQSKHFKWRLFYPFAITSVPAAFLGGLININITLYKQILAILLLFSIFRLLGFFGKESKSIKELKLWQGLVIGAIIGLFSGMIGIGGGIVLSPVILLFKWGKMKSTAAVSALFIWVNSAAALTGI